MNSTETARQHAIQILKGMQLKPRVDALFKQRVREFNCKGALPRALFKEILRNSLETARRRAIQNNLAGIQLKRRVDALFKAG